MGTLKMAEKKAERILTKNNYTIQKIKSCLYCKYSEFVDFQESLTCTLLTDKDWIVDAVNNFGICDKYEKSNLIKL